MTSRLPHPIDEYLALLSDGPGRSSTLSVLQGAARYYGADSARSMRWERLRRADIIALRSMLQRSDLALATARKTLYAVRKLIYIYHLRRRVSRADWLAIADVPPPKGSRTPAGRAPAASEIAAMLAATTPNEFGLRDAAALVLMTGFGLRRAEACAARVEDYDAEHGELRVIGKGNRERVAACIGDGPVHLDAWLSCRGRTHGPIICALRPLRPGTALSGPRVSQRLDALRRAAGVPKCTPHDLRRAFVTRLLEAGLDYGTVARAAGHASTETTMLYDRRSWAAASSTIRRVSLTDRTR